MNALFCDPEGRIYDPFDGLHDLGAGRVRFVGDAAKRVDEDALRILRYFRFYAHFGQPPPDIDALAACRTQAAKLATLSGERIAGELFRLLEAPEPTAVLLLMEGERVLRHMLPEARDFGRLRVLTFLEVRGILRPRIGVDALRRLAALLPADAAAASSVADRLRLSNQQSARLVEVAAPQALPDPDRGQTEARALLHRIGAERFVDLALLAWAARRAADTPRSGSGDNERWTALIDAALEWLPRKLPVGGEDALALGLAPGPKVGELLAELERWWIAGDFRAGRDEALARLKELAAKAS